jgi:hypothetical protein
MNDRKLIFESLKTLKSSLETKYRDFTVEFEYNNEIQLFLINNLINFKKEILRIVYMNFEEDSDSIYPLKIFSSNNLNDIDGYYCNSISDVNEAIIFIFNSDIKKIIEMCNLLNDKD